MPCLCRAPLVAAFAMVLAVTRIVVAAPADRIVRGGPIVTVNPAQPVAEAVAIAGGRIVEQQVWNDLAEAGVTARED